MSVRAGHVCGLYNWPRSHAERYSITAADLLIHCRPANAHAISRACIYACSSLAPYSLKHRYAFAISYSFAIAD